MKAEHRHELKTNELAQWLNNLPTWSKQNLKTLIYVAVVLVLVLASAIYHYFQKTVQTGREQTNMTMLMSQLPQQRTYIAQAQAQGMDNSYMLLQTADGLDEIAAGTKQNDVGALSLIKEADILRTELHFRFGAISQEDLAKQIERAKENYTKAIETYLKDSPNLSLEAYAKLGLGLCEEELGNFEQARNLYNELLTSPAYDGTTAVASANNRLATIDYFKDKIILKPAPKTETTATTESMVIQPDIMFEEPVPESMTPPSLPEIQVAPEANL